MALGGTRPPDTSAQMDIRQVTGPKGKSMKGKKGKSKEKSKGKKDQGEARGNAWIDDSYFADECGYCGTWGQQKRDQGSKPDVWDHE